jgi:hypothetical protein
VTIAVALAVPDGIALAADTQTTWQRAITKATDKATGKEVELAQPILVPIGWSRMARKLFSIRMVDSTYAVAVSGAALLNNKTPFSIFKSLETSYQGDGSYDGVMKHLVEGLKAELRKQLGVTDLPTAPQVVDLNFILAGYEDHDVARPILRVTSVYSGKPPAPQFSGYPGQLTSWQNAPDNRFGCCWTGRSDFIDHIVNHKNPSLPPIAGHYPGMTLADALDYVRFLAEFTCDFQRFAVMVPDCGRPVLTASLTPVGYEDHLARGA